MLGGEEEEVGENPEWEQREKSKTHFTPGRNYLDFTYMKKKQRTLDPLLLPKR